MLRKCFGVTHAFVFDNAESLRTLHPSKRFFKSKRYKTYGLWLTGQEIRRDLILNGTSNIQQVVLPDPRNNEMLTELDRSFASRFVLGSSNEIKKSARSLGQLGARVYWCDEWPGVALTFHMRDMKNENSEPGKGSIVCVQPIPRYMPLGDGPVMCLRQGKNPEAFDAYWKLYRRTVQGASMAALPSPNVTTISPSVTTVYY